jgi:hypothetical protein
MFNSILLSYFLYVAFASECNIYKGTDTYTALSRPDGSGFVQNDGASGAGTKTAFTNVRYFTDDGPLVGLKWDGTTIAFGAGMSSLHGLSNVIGIYSGASMGGAAYAQLADFSVVTGGAGSTKSIVGLTFDALIKQFVSVSGMRVFLLTNGKILITPESSNANKGVGVVDFSDNNFINIWGSCCQILAERSNGTIVSWGAYGVGSPFNGDLTTRRLGRSITSMLLGYDGHFHAVLSDNTVASWGPTVPVGLTTGVPNGVTIRSGAATQGGFCFVRSDSEMFCSGANQGGNGPPSSNVSYVISTQFGYAALLNDGTIKTFGATNHGGTRADVTGVSKIVSNGQAGSDSDNTYVALKTDNTLITWGATSRTFPTTLNGASTNYLIGSTERLNEYNGFYASIHSFTAFKTDGTAVSWTSNSAYHIFADETCSVTITPTKSPTKSPTKTPTKAPTKTPTKAPSQSPTRAPTVYQGIVIGTAEITHNVLNNTARSAITLQTISDVKSRGADPARMNVTVTSTEEFIIPYDVYIQAANLSDFRTKVAAARGCSGCVITPILPTRRMLGRELSNSIIVSIVYTLSEAGYTSLVTSGANPGSTEFATALATSLSISVGDVVVTTFSGTITISIAFSAVPGDAGIDEASLTELQNINTNLNNATQTLVTLLGSGTDNVETVTLDLCGTRDCNSRGVCSQSTGICACTGTFWGVNCETACSCDNGGDCQATHAYCECDYPNYGKRCGSTKLI